MSSKPLTRSVAAALAVTAIATSPASARPMGETQPIGVETGLVTNPTVITTTDRGFDWGAAGLGAGAAGAIVLLSFVGVTINGRAHVRSVS